MKKTKRKCNIKVAIIGAGAMANAVHYPSLMKMKNVKIVGLCDFDAKRRKATAKTFGIEQTFNDYRRMLDETQPDAVYALMPPHVLFDVAMDVLDRGKHLFIEKPPAVTTFQTECLAKRAEEKGVITAVGFQRRYHPLAQTCWERVRKKASIQQVVACFYKNQSPTEQHPYYRGAIDILRCDAIHAVDSLRYYCGLSEVRTVTADVRNLDAWYATSFNAIIHFENDAVGILMANWRVGARRFTFEFHSCGHSAHVNIDGQGQVWTDNQTEPTFSQSCTDAVNSEEMYLTQGFYAENKAFIEAIRSNTQLHNNLSDAVKTMRLVDQIYACDANRHNG